MNKFKIISVLAGLGSIMTTIIMVIHLPKVCYEYSMHPEWSLGAWNAVQITATLYGIVIAVFTIVLVGLNVKK